MQNDQSVKLYGITDSRLLGQAVKAIRKGQRITQKELAVRTGISRLCLSDLETGNRSVGSANQFKVLNALGYEVALIPRSNTLSDPDN